jgi:uncharacterized protein (TIGR00288 family)
VTPWWSRPTAEGAEESENPEERQQDEALGTEADQPPPAQSAGDQSSAEKGEAPPRVRAGRSRAGRAGAAAAPSRGEPAAKAPAARPAAPSRRQEPAARSPNGAPKKAAQEPRRQEPEGRRGPAEPRPAGARKAPPGNGAREREELRPGDTVSVPLSELQELTREIVISMPDRDRSGLEERKIALFCDLENVALGARDSGSKFDIQLVLERLLEKGKIIVKKAYADWQRYSDYKRPFHEAGIELIDIPLRSYSGKNSADIKMVVDAMDLSYSKEHLDTFALLSGDSDFSPLVSKLKENNKYVIAVGLKESSSNLLIDNCDEFIYYEDISRDVERIPRLDGLPKKEKELFELLVDSILALTRENKDVLWGSMIKQTMQRKKPSFNEGYYGYSTFSELLEDAKKKNIVEIEKDKRSGSYIVTGFARRK